MIDSHATNEWAVRLPASPIEQRTMEAALGSGPWSAATKFLPKDDDELNADLSAGRFKQVAFADLDSLLEMMWKDEVDADGWQRAGVHVELISPPPGPKDAWHDIVRNVHRSLARWRSQQRKRQIVAAVILSATALAAMAALFWFIPPPQ